MEAPESVVVQILSMSKGLVRLSWLFRWNAEALPCDQKLAQGFEVRLPDDHPAAKDIGNRWQCRSSPFQLELPRGHCYLLQLRAVLMEGAQVVWASEFSAPARVDLRQNAGSKHRAEAAGKPRFQDFLVAKPSERRVDPYRSSPRTSPRVPLGAPKLGALPVASSPSTSAGDGALSEDTSPLRSVVRRSILELLFEQAVRKAFFDFLPMVMVARMRSASPAVKAQAAAYLHARVNTGSSEEFDLEGEEPVAEVPPAEEATQAPQIALQEVTLVHEDQLAHISGSLICPPLLRTPRGTFRSEAAPLREAERDLGRLMANSGFRIFLTSSAASVLPVRLQARPGIPILHDLHLLLEQQLSMALDTSFSERVATAMSAGIGVDFAVQVGLIPQFHQPMFILLLLGSGGQPQQVRMVVNGFVAAKSKHVQGDRPDQKFTPWIASLASPDLMQPQLRTDGPCQWEYSVRHANGSETTGSALECDVLLLQDIAASGRWTGLPQL